MLIFNKNPANPLLIFWNNLPSGFLSVSAIKVTPPRNIYGIPKPHTKTVKRMDRIQSDHPRNPIQRLKIHQNYCTVFCPLLSFCVNE